MDPLLEALDQAQLQLLLLKCGIVPARADAHSQRLAGAYTCKGLLAVATDPDLVASILAGDGAPVLGQHKADAKAIQRYIADAATSLWGSAGGYGGAGNTAKEQAKSHTYQTSDLQISRDEPIELQHFKLNLLMATQALERRQSMAKGAAAAPMQRHSLNRSYDELRERLLP